MDQQLVIKLDGNTSDAKPIGLVESPPLLYLNFKNLHPGVTFSEKATPSELEPYGYGVFEHSIPPSDLTYNESYDDIGITKNNDGVWTQSYPIRQATDEEIKARFKGESVKARQKRMLLLRRTDYIFGGDAPNNVVADVEAWKNYRQALRDISSQPNFPWEIEWPLAPNPVVGNPTRANEDIVDPSDKDTN